MVVPRDPGDLAGHQAHQNHSTERVNDFATPGVMNLLCGAVDCVRGVSPVVAG
jgi:hypothetical protein